MSIKINNRIDGLKNKLEILYGDRGAEVLNDIEKRILVRGNSMCKTKPMIDENDVMLITYGDTLKDGSQVPLAVLKEFLNDYLKDTVTSVHILPFYPYTSDDGFSVVDYRQINPELGNWPDVQELAKDFDLMFDGVINHISKSSAWFQGYLKGESKYEQYFIEADPTLDYSNVIRPRALPLLTPFRTNRGIKHIWTTFSDDQIDLNFANPDVLLEVLDVLLMYAKQGARFIRLDAIGFAWKKIGTSCMHLEETHALIKVIREFLDAAAPGTIIITETNVPHDDNISYFGNGSDEAHLVYQFPLPPLTLFSFHMHNARKLLEWANGLEPISAETTYFNFLSSHDGIGMRPLEGILTDGEKQLMVDKTLQHGGLVSYKDDGGGKKSPYELNITYLDALSHPDESDRVRVNKFLAAHTILLSVIGMPGIYIHSLLGSRNDYKGVAESNINRRINREKLNVRQLHAELDKDPIRNSVFNRFSRLIRLRRAQSAFHPHAGQEVLFLDDRVFSIIRTNTLTGERILVLVNVSNEQVSVRTPISGLELISGKEMGGDILMQPYQAVWLKQI